jgi:DNA-directed RNA polymerase subunit beta'
LHSPLWFQRGTNLQVITSRNREKPIEVQYDPLGTSSQIYEHYQLGRNKEDFFFGIYVCTTVGRVIFNQQIEEVLQSTLKASRHRDRPLPTIII